MLNVLRRTKHQEIQVIFFFTDLFIVTQIFTLFYLMLILMRKIFIFADFYILSLKKKGDTVHNIKKFMFYLIFFNWLIFTKIIMLVI